MAFLRGCQDRQVGSQEGLGLPLLLPGLYDTQLEGIVSNKKSREWRPTEARRTLFRRIVAGRTTWLGRSEGRVMASPWGKEKQASAETDLTWRGWGGAKMSAEPALSDSVPVQGMGSHDLGGGSWHTAPGDGPCETGMSKSKGHAHPSLCSQSTLSLRI